MSGTKYEIKGFNKKLLSFLLYLDRSEYQTAPIRSI